MTIATPNHELIGWPETHYRSLYRYDVPAKGETIRRPDGVLVTVVYADLTRVCCAGFGVAFDSECEITDEFYPTVTGDGLYWRRNGGDDDGYVAYLTKDGWPGHREWEVRR